MIQRVNTYISLDQKYSFKMPDQEGSSRLGSKRNDLPMAENTWTNASEDIYQLLAK